MIHILALLAKAGHGKTTAANYLRDTRGAKIVSLATPLKKIAQATMGFSDAQLWGTQEEKESVRLPERSTVEPAAIIPGAVTNAYGDLMSARIFLQKLGTEGIRKHLGPRTWLEALAYNVAEDYAASAPSVTANDNNGLPAQTRDAVYMVDDVRFINEAEFVHDELKNRPGLPKFFGTVIKLVCTDAPPSGNDNHPSEREVDLVPDRLVDAVVTSSRALGTEHLIEQLEAALALPHLANVRGALNRCVMARAARERTERLAVMGARTPAAGGR